MNAPPSTERSPEPMLTQEDVKRLLHEPIPATRAAIATKIAAGHASGRFKTSELQVAEQIFRLLLRDAEVEVRTALAEGLKQDEKAPRDIIKALAADADPVSLPVLRHSPVLEDEDLLDIINEHAEITRYIAIANRERVSRTVSTALVETVNENVAQHLVKNQGAELSEHSYNRILEHFPGSEPLTSLIANRPELPPTVVEKLVTVVSDSVARQLKQQYAGVAKKLEEEAKRARDAVMLKMLDSTVEAEEVQALIDELYAGKRLTPSLILTSLCRGNFRFFEASLARMAGIPIANARKLINDRGDLGFRALYKKAELPESMFEACRVVLEVMHEMHDQGDAASNNIHYANRVVERIFTKTNGREIENLAYIIALIRQNFR